jgi:hypothetical protein
MKTTIKTIAIVSAFAMHAFAALDAHAGDIIKRDALPATLKGGKVAKNADGVPSCTVGRAKLAASDELVIEWKSTHEKHDCAGASVVYVCRAGKNLSVRCE